MSNQSLQGFKEGTLLNVNLSNDDGIEIRTHNRQKGKDASEEAQLLCWNVFRLGYQACSYFPERNSLIFAVICPMFEALHRRQDGSGILFDPRVDYYFPTPNNTRGQLKRSFHVRLYMRYVVISFNRALNTFGSWSGYDGRVSSDDVPEYSTSSMHGITKNRKDEVQWHSSTRFPCINIAMQNQKSWTSLSWSQRVCGTYPGTPSESLRDR